MCLGIPGEILEIFPQHELRFAKVRFGGITREVCLECQPDAADVSEALIFPKLALLAGYAVWVCMSYVAFLDIVAE